MKYFYFTLNLYCADTGVGAVLKVLNCRTSVRTSNNYILTEKSMFYCSLLTIHCKYHGYPAEIQH